jgi:hypothetical protein
MVHVGIVILVFTGELCRLCLVNEDLIHQKNSAKLSKS